MTLQRRNILASALILANDYVADSAVQVNRIKSEVRNIFDEQDTVISCYEKDKSL